ncbi:hypothetical protein K6168_11515 [Streptomyces sp. FB2]|uniref:hypothetical protein n=2 Tax=Streptomyces TaxID=1883 RepID=UPI001F1FBFED|nr:hypothetical protein [Streptomyces sp. FB2]MCF2536282.1 hypothetical protein [Streptomyces sp. FB2]
MSRLKTVALWGMLALCVVFIARVGWGFLQFEHDVENPREGGFSGWQCERGEDCGNRAGAQASGVSSSAFARSAGVS